MTTEDHTILDAEFLDGVGRPDAGNEKPSPHLNNVLKNDDRIKGIRSRMFLFHDIRLCTPIAKRHLRRDFNIATAKMYVFGLNRDYKKEIIRALEDLEFAIDLLEMSTACWTKEEHPLTPCSFKMHLVSPQSVRMMRALVKFDKCMIGVYTAYLSGDISKEEKRELLHPFELAYTNFKRVAMKLNGNATVDEMVSEVEQEVQFY